MIGFVVGGFDLAGGPEDFVGPVVKQRIGQRSAYTLVKQDEHQRGFGPFVGDQKPTLQQKGFFLNGRAAGI